MFDFLQKFGSVYSAKFVIFLIIVGIILIFWDAKKLKKYGMHKEYVIAKSIGIIYFFLAGVFYVAGYLFN